MKKFFGKYLWLIEFISVALIVSLGVVVLFVLKGNEKILYIPFGVLFTVLGLIRFVPLLKTTDDKALKWMNAIELTIDLLAGIFLIVFAFIKNEEFDLGNALGFIVSALLILRAVVYFYSTSIRKQNTTTFMFVFHLLLIVSGSIFIGMGGFNTEDVKYVVFALCILCALYLTVDAYKKYSNYRSLEYAKNKSKEINIEEETKVEAPSADEIIEQNEITERDNPEDGLNA